MSIMLVTFKTDRTILGEVVNESSSTIFVKKPVQVVTIPPRGPNDSGGVAFSPFLEYSEEFETGVMFKLEDILTKNTPVRELINQYNQIFGSGIQIASSVPKV
jgi:hypothetical protein